MVRAPRGHIRVRQKFVFERETEREREKERKKERKKERTKERKERKRDTQLDKLACLTLSLSGSCGSFKGLAWTTAPHITPSPGESAPAIRNGVQFLPEQVGSSSGQSQNVTNAWPKKTCRMGQPSSGGWPTKTMALHQWVGAFITFDMNWHRMVDTPQDPRLVNFFHWRCQGGRRHPGRFPGAYRARISLEPHRRSVGWNVKGTGKRNTCWLGWSGNSTLDPFQWSI